MYEVFGHIFGSLEVANRRIGRLARAMAKQGRMNRLLGLMGIAAGTGLLANSIRLTKMEREVDHLRTRVEELEDALDNCPASDPDDFEN